MEHVIKMHLAPTEKSPGGGSIVGKKLVTACPRRGRSKDLTAVPAYKDLKESSNLPTRQ